MNAPRAGSRQPVRLSARFPIVDLAMTDMEARTEAIERINDVGYVLTDVTHRITGDGLETERTITITARTTIPHRITEPTPISL